MCTQAAMLDEMDAAFGVSALLPPRAPPAPAPYRAPSLRGLRVAHQLDAVLTPSHPPYINGNTSRLFDFVVIQKI